LVDRVFLLVAIRSKYLIGGESKKTLLARLRRRRALKFVQTAK
jgi:hypothetical protein